MTQEEFTAIKSFLPELFLRSREAHRKHIDKEKALLKPFFSELANIEQKKQDHIKAHAPYFNIFGIMRYGHYETRLHTPFLVHLLRTHEAHQAGSFLLSHFIREVYPGINMDEVGEIEVFEEYPFEFWEMLKKENKEEKECVKGRIDIYIRFCWKSSYYFIAIENKINAADQEKQLYRYYRFLHRQTIDHDKMRLIYLTKRGTLPKMPCSLERTDYDQLTHMGVLSLMSYSGHITNWINHLLEMGNPEVVSFTLKQYLQNIKYF